MFVCTCRECKGGTWRRHAAGATTAQDGQARGGTGKLSNGGGDRKAGGRARAPMGKIAGRFCFGSATASGAASERALCQIRSAPGSSSAAATIGSGKKVSAGSCGGRGGGAARLASAHASRVALQARRASRRQSACNAPPVKGAPKVVSLVDGKTHQRGAPHCRSRSLTQIVGKQKPTHVRHGARRDRPGFRVGGRAPKVLHCHVQSVAIDPSPVPNQLGCVCSWGFEAEGWLAGPPAQCGGGRR